MLCDSNASIIWDNSWDSIIQKYVRNEFYYKDSKMKLFGYSFLKFWKKKSKLNLQNLNLTGPIFGCVGHGPVS